MAELLPQIKARFFDENGAPLSGGKIETYVAGTSTPKATYIDEAESSINTNPVILDSEGYADIFISGGGYKFIVKDSDDNLVFSIDNITRPSTGPQGASFLVGTGAPASSLGTDGDYYLDAGSGTIYSKATGSWSATSDNIFSGAMDQELTGGSEEITDLVVSSTEFIQFDVIFTVLRGSDRQQTKASYLFTGAAWEKSGEQTVNSQSVTFSIDSSTGQVSANGTSGDKLKWKVTSKIPVEA